MDTPTEVFKGVYTMIHLVTNFNDLKKEEIESDESRPAPGRTLLVQISENIVFSVETRDDLTYLLETHRSLNIRLFSADSNAIKKRICSAQTKAVSA